MHLAHGDVGVRPLRMSDARDWVALRRADEAWLSPWEGAPESARPVSWEDRHSPQAFAALLQRSRREGREGRGLPCAVTWHGRLVGQVSLGGLVRGAFDSGWVGYWITSGHAGRGIVPVAVALLVDHCFGPVGLHRVEANVRPENAASRRVVAKLGFTEEGLHRRYLHIDGDWRDHLSYALLREDAPEGVLARYLAARPAP